MFWSTAMAQTAGAASQPSMLQSFLPMILIFAVFYFFIIRPQAKRAKTHAQVLSELKRGDEVITASGIWGRIEGLTGAFITLEVADGVKIKSSSQANRR